MRIFSDGAPISRAATNGLIWNFSDLENIPVVLADKVHSVADDFASGWVGFCRPQ